MFVVPIGASEIRRITPAANAPYTPYTGLAPVNDGLIQSGYNFVQVISLVSFERTRLAARGGEHHVIYGLLHVKIDGSSRNNS